MNIASVVIASIIFSLIALQSTTVSVGSMTAISQVKQKQKMEQIGRAVLEYYDDNGTLPSSVADLKNYTSLMISENVFLDSTDHEFALLDNAGSPFTFEGGGSYLLAIVAPGSDGLDSSISNNELTIKHSEDAYLLSKDSFDTQTSRGQTISKVAKCTNAYTVYQNVEGAAPGSIFDLVSKGYLEGRDILDGWGVTMNITTGKCYSFGPNGQDDSAGGDDIS